MPTSWDRFASGAMGTSHRELLDPRGLPLRYYRETTLADPLARRIFVLPDRAVPPTPRI